MAIGVDDTVIIPGTSDGDRVALKVRPPLNSGELCVGLRTSDRLLSACGVKPMLYADKLGFSAKTSEGDSAALVPSRLPFIAMCWIDESSPYINSLETYNADKEYYLAQRARSPKFADGLYSPTHGRPGTGLEYCKHEDGEFPVIMETYDVGRPPGDNELIEYFEDLLESFQHKDPIVVGSPDTLILGVDNSGSMSTSTIQPAYGLLKDYVSANYPSIEIYEEEFGNERWLRLFADAIENVV